MNISIVIPAYNAAATIAETLESLCAQTLPSWEAVVIDDGSTDETAAIAATFVEREPRIRLIVQPHLGACIARNNGLQLSNFEWLLFLDADDLLVAYYLERMTETLAANPDLDAVYCEWDRITMDDEILNGDKYPPGELFEIFARRPLFPPFACIVRRSLVEEVGGWDTSFSCCQDWDLWQRCTRTNARFGAIREVLGYYRVRQGSVSTQAPEQLLTQGLRVINQGYTFDPRVPNPNPTYAAGLIARDQSQVQVIWLSWCAGLALGLGQDVSVLLRQVGQTHSVELNPFHLAECIFRAVPLSLGQLSDVWIQLWPALEQRVEEFLIALEAWSTTPRLAWQVSAILEEQVLQTVAGSRPFTVGRTQAICLEVTRPIEDVSLPPPVERLLCEVVVEGKLLGSVTLEASDGVVKADTISAAVANEYAWPILGRFFQHTIYPYLRIERQPDDLSLWRGMLCLARNLPNGDTFWSVAHDKVGWTLFLQELWARPEWSDASFYDPQMAEELSSSPCLHSNTAVRVEVSEELPTIITIQPELDVTLTVGGIALGQTILAVEGGFLRPQELRAALTAYGGLDLCRLVVRVCLIGRPLAESTSLRARLTQAASQHRKLSANIATRIRVFISRQCVHLFLWWHSRRQ